MDIIIICAPDWRVVAGGGGGSGGDGDTVESDEDDVEPATPVVDDADADSVLAASAGGLVQTAEAPANESRR